jgi:hypothetical protein
MSKGPARIRSVEPLEGFVLRLAFDDGSERTVDLEAQLGGPMFEPLHANPELFRQVRVDDELGTIVWPNGPTWTLTSFTAISSRPSRQLLSGSRARSAELNTPPRAEF